MLPDLDYFSATLPASGGPPTPGTFSAGRGRDLAAHPLPWHSTESSDASVSENPPTVVRSLSVGSSGSSPVAVTAATAAAPQTRSPVIRKRRDLGPTPSRQPASAASRRSNKKNGEKEPSRDGRVEVHEESSREGRVEVLDVESDEEEDEEEAAKNRQLVSSIGLITQEETRYGTGQSFTLVALGLMF